MATATLTPLLCRAVLAYEHAAAASSVQLLEGGLAPQPRLCRRVAAMVSLRAPL
jgi:hypothetical protein